MEDPPVIMISSLSGSGMAKAYLSEIKLTQYYINMLYAVFFLFYIVKYFRLSPSSIEPSSFTSSVDQLLLLMPPPMRYTPFSVDQDT